MQSDLTGSGGGGGLPDFYAASRSIANAMNNHSQPALFLDQTASRIPCQSPHSALIGKRTLAEFQSHQGYLVNGIGAPVNSLALAAHANYLHAVKPWPYQHSSDFASLSDRILAFHAGVEELFVLVVSFVAALRETERKARV